MDTDRIVLGVDVGGTKIRYGLMDMEGTVLADDQCRSRAMPCREWFSFITEKLDSFLKANPEGKAAQAIFSRFFPWVLLGYHGIRSAPPPGNWWRCLFLAVS